MTTLETKYMNLNLRNPIIVASSGLTKTEEKIKQCEEAGAGAVVLKSLFEESLAREDWGVDSSTAHHTEVYDYLRSELQLQYGPQEYCNTIFNVKKQVEIPIIASINCVSSKWWPSFARQIEAAGADALELNVFTTAYDPATESAEIEQLYYQLIEEVKGRIDIPVAMKIGSNFTSLPNVAYNLCQKGADALVLFNRFTEPDIDINNLSLRTTFTFSRKEDMHKTLRGIALLAGKVSCDLAATTGIHSGGDIIKMLLAGATAVQLASVLYKKGLSVISEMTAEIDEWMRKHNFSSIEDFRGKLSFARVANPEHYLRVQFMEKIRGYE